MRRRWVNPVQLVLIVAFLCLLPAIALLGTFGLQAKASVLHVAATYATLILGFRLIGKRELGQLTPFDLVTLMLIPEILSNTVQGDGSLLTGISGLSTVLVLVVTTSALSQRFGVVERVLEPSPTILVVDGKLLESNMNRERITPGELFGEMHKYGIDGLDKIRFAVLEGSGNISFVKVDERILDT